MLKIGAVLSCQDEDKAILKLAEMSVFLVRAARGQTSNFLDIHGNERFSLTFEVDGLTALEHAHQASKEREIKVGEIENRGHAGRNFVFEDPDGNKFDVWSDLSLKFKEKYFARFD